MQNYIASYKNFQKTDMTVMLQFASTMCKKALAQQILLSSAKLVQKY